MMCRIRIIDEYESHFQTTCLNFFVNYDDLFTAVLTHLESLFKLWIMDLRYNIYSQQNEQFHTQIPLVRKCGSLVILKGINQY